MKRLLPFATAVVFAFAGLPFGSRAVAGILIHQSFSGSQGTNGIYYEAIGDSRSTNTQNPGAEGVTPLRFNASFNYNYPGNVARPTYYLTPSLFPHIQDWSSSGFLDAHPGTGGYSLGAGTANLGVSIRFVAAVSGLFEITGGFARFNTNYGYGNGVEVLVAKNGDLDTSLFKSSISQNHHVDVMAPFEGTGVASFSFKTHLLAGDSLRFIVFADGQGQDGTFDSTAIRASINAVDATIVPEPSSLAYLLGLAGLALISQRRRRKQDCELVKSLSVNT